ncbi:hypothetical protein AVEN_40133-1 [Araneus ventricosus]|uniref:HTH psq-type domain-containing protein n=1 Tax=Araneus ventricosus TaxID=182803 RepID=A0A4Y2EMI3_ARAVE|nr:hypothetical protein AVEN_40133-1 [Araneus ventricosus]
MSVILTNSIRKPISCCVYVTGSTNLTTRVKSVCKTRLWGVVAIKKYVNCQFELQKWKMVPWRRKKVNVKRKFNVLTVKKKVEIFEAVDKGGKKGQIAKGFKIPTSTLSTILKDREKIKRLFELKKVSMKKIRIEILN